MRGRVLKCFANESKLLLTFERSKGLGIDANIDHTLSLTLQKSSLRAVDIYRTLRAFLDRFLYR